MTINENISIELDKNISDYFVIVKAISEKMVSLEKLELQYNESRLAGKVDKKVLGALKKDTYLYQFYNVFLVKIISNIRLLYKLAKVSDIEIQKELEESIVKIIESDPETLVVDNGEILIIDENLKEIFENQLSEVSDEEIAKIMKSKNEESK